MAKTEHLTHLYIYLTDKQDNEKLRQDELVLQCLEHYLLINLRFIFRDLFHRESEAFEALCPARLDELLKEANKLEQHLKNEKENMRERLTLLTRTLQMI